MFPSTRLRYHTTTSTNDRAREWSITNPGTSALVTATHQTRGRGRRGAQWHDDSGQAALMTFVAVLPVPPAESWKMAFVGSLAAQRACAVLAEGKAVQIKWPNDLVFNCQKLGGILVETVPTGGNAWAALLGIGINVATPLEIPGSSFASRPTSLEEISGRPRLDTEAVIQVVSRELAGVIETHKNADWWPRILREWRTNLVTGLDQIGTDDAGNSVRGILEDIDEDTGRARLRTQDGAMAIVRPL